MYWFHRFNFQHPYILELLINNSYLTKINSGGIIGLEGTVFVKIPIISDCPDNFVYHLAEFQWSDD